MTEHYGIDYEAKHISVRGHIYWAEYEEDPANDYYLLSFETETAWDACNDIYTTLKDAINEWCEKMNMEQGEGTDEEMMDFINEYDYDDDDTYLYIRQFTFEELNYGGMRSLPMAYHRIIHIPMYTGEDNSTDLIGTFCELLFPRKSQRNGIIVDDYGNEWLVQLTNGREVPVYKDEDFDI